MYYEELMKLPHPTASTATKMSVSTNSQHKLVSKIPKLFPILSINASYYLLTLQMAAAVSKVFHAQSLLNCSRETISYKPQQFSSKGDAIPYFIYALIQSDLILKQLHYFLHGEGKDLSVYKSICKTVLYLEVSLTKMKRQPEASFVCSGIVENTDKIKQPNTRRKLKEKEY